LHQHLANLPTAHQGGLEARTQVFLAAGDVGAQTPDPEALDDVARGDRARLVQHEYDHLDGILFPMRMDEIGALAFDDQAPPGAFRIGREDCPDPVGEPAPV